MSIDNRVKELLEEYAMGDVFSYLDLDSDLTEKGLLSTLVADCIKDLNLVEADQWVSVDKLELETPAILKTESGQIITGWKRLLKGDDFGFDNDIHFCFGNEYTSWDWDWNFDVGAVIGWKPLPTTQ